MTDGGFLDAKLMIHDNDVTQSWKMHGEECQLKDVRVWRGFQKTGN